MNREMKFRVFDLNGNPYKMYYDPIISDGHGNISLKTIMDSLKNDGWIWMQYTGRSDRKGKEIYEFDIVQWMENGKLLKGFVVWHKEYCRFNVAWAHELKIFQEKGSHGSQRFLSGDEPLEVIGNIYENPNLINE